MIKNKYGYKLCDSNGKIHLVTNSLWIAKLEQEQNSNLDIYPVKNTLNIQNFGEVVRLEITSSIF